MILMRVSTPISVSALLIVLICSVSPAQSGQPNSPQASLTIGGQGGPPYPIVNILILTGTDVSLDIGGGAFAPFLVAQTPSLSATGLPLLGGILNLEILADPTALTIIMDGFSGAPATFATDFSGQFSQVIAVPGTQLLNQQMAFQGVVQDPASPFGHTLTAASSIITVVGLTQINLPLGDDNCLFVATATQFGINIPFYGATYDGCWVCANGYITFGTQSTDFTPSLVEMYLLQPRIAPFWCDLLPTDPTAGPVTATMDQTDPNNPVLTVKWDHIPDWPVGVAGGIPWHTFGARIDIPSGDVEIHEYPFNSNSHYDTLMGMSSGGALDPLGVHGMDLSATFAQGPYPGLPDEGMYEGFSGVTSVTGSFPPLQIYDLTNNFWRYSAHDLGTPNARYTLDYFIPADPFNP